MHGRLARVHIDGQRVGFATGSRATEQIELTGDINRLPLSVRGAHIRTFIVTIEIRCERTNRAVEEWRLATYSAILEAYQEKRREYEEKLAALQVQAGVAISGRNPEANRVLERDELKKSCISLLTRRNFNASFPENAVFADDNFPNGPLIAFDKAEIVGPLVRFFEQAFEWHNMTYVLYPYFWGRSEEYPSRINTTTTFRITTTFCAFAP